MNYMQEIAEAHELTFTWLSDVGYDYAEYETEEEDGTVRVWNENARSLEAKLNYLSRFNIAGVSYWRLGQETADVWDTVEKYFQD